MTTNKLPGALTLEQELKLKVLSGQVKNLNLEQSHEYILELSRQVMVTKNITKSLLKGERLL